MEKLNNDNRLEPPVGGWRQERIGGENEQFDEDQQAQAFLAEAERLIIGE